MAEAVMIAGDEILDEIQSSVRPSLVSTV